mmetsp:Transcript_26928/g.60779  ORF Transcript_26928/g.60779 Transcript_26928/m.60779 type:complete len:557 (+) Transcript_26928:23-1693(+)
MSDDPGVVDVSTGPCLGDNGIVLVDLLCETSGEHLPREGFTAEQVAVTRRRGLETYRVHIDDTVEQAAAAGEDLASIVSAILSNPSVVLTHWLAGEVVDSLLAASPKLCHVVGDDVKGVKATVAHVAVRWGKDVLLRKVLAAGVDIKCRTVDGGTLLHLLVDRLQEFYFPPILEGCAEIGEFLMLEKVNWRAKRKSGSGSETALECLEKAFQVSRATRTSEAMTVHLLLDTVLAGVDGRPAPEAPSAPTPQTASPETRVAMANTLKREANRCFQHKEVQVACSKWEEALAHIEDLGTADGLALRVAINSNLAQGYLQQELWRRAESCATQAIELATDVQVKALFRRALAREALKNFMGAEEDLGAVLEAEPEDSQAKAVLNRILDKMAGEMMKAAADDKENFVSDRNQIKASLKEFCNSVPGMFSEPFEEPTDAARIRKQLERFNQLFPKDGEALYSEDILDLEIIRDTKCRVFHHKDLGVEGKLPLWVVASEALGVIKGSALMHVDQRVLAVRGEDQPEKTQPEYLGLELVGRDTVDGHVVLSAVFAEERRQAWC